MKGINHAEQTHIVQLIKPSDVDDNTARTSEVASMANHAHATIIVSLGVTGATMTLKVQACDDFTPSNTTDIAFSVYKEETADGDTLGSRVDATSSGITTSGNDGVLYVIEVDASALPDGKPNIRINLSDPAAATFCSAVAILSGSRYAGEQNATAIA